MDTTIIVENQKIIFDIFQKTTSSSRFLNFNSQHSLCHKIGVIYSFVDRIVKLSRPHFHKKNLIDAIRMLLRNGYPLSFIFSRIDKRIKMLIHNNYITHDAHLQLKDKFFTIPYVKSISESFLPLITKFNCKLVFFIVSFQII